MLAKHFAEFSPRTVNGVLYYTKNGEEHSADIGYGETSDVYRWMILHLAYSFDGRTTVLQRGDTFSFRVTFEHIEFTIRLNPWPGGEYSACVVVHQPGKTSGSREGYYSHRPSINMIEMILRLVQETITYQVGDRRYDSGVLYSHLVNCGVSLQAGRNDAGISGIYAQFTHPRRATIDPEPVYRLTYAGKTEIISAREIAEVHDFASIIQPIFKYGGDRRTTDIIRNASGEYLSFGYYQGTSLHDPMETAKTHRARNHIIVISKEEHLTLLKILNPYLGPSIRIPDLKWIDKIK